MVENICISLLSWSSITYYSFPSFRIKRRFWTEYIPHPYFMLNHVIFLISSSLHFLILLNQQVLSLYYGFLLSGFHWVQHDLVVPYRSISFGLSTIQLILNSSGLSNFAVSSTLHWILVAHFGTFIEPSFIFHLFSFSGYFGPSTFHWIFFFFLEPSFIYSVEPSFYIFIHWIILVLRLSFGFFYSLRNLRSLILLHWTFVHLFHPLDNFGPSTFLWNFIYLFRNLRSLLLLLYWTFVL